MTKTDQMLTLPTVIVLLLAFVGCTESGTGGQTMESEELRTLNEQVMKQAVTSPDSALLMIDAFRADGLLPDYRSELLRAKIFAQTVEGMRLDSAIIIGERLMTIDEAKKDLAYRQDVLEMLVSACHQHHDDELTMFYCKRLMELRRQQGDETEALRNEVEIGMILAATGRLTEGLAKIDSVISLLSGTQKLKEMNVCLFALQHKITVLNNAQSAMHNAPLGHADKSQCADNNALSIVDCASKMLDMLSDYEQKANEVRAGTNAEPTADLSPDFIDFLRSWAYVFMANAHARLNEKEKAEEYLALCESTKRAQSYEVRKDIAPVYCLIGEFDKMDAIHAEEEARLRMKNDTISVDYAAILHDRAAAAEAQGRYAEAFRLCREYEALVKTLNERLLQSKAKLYAARYHALEQRREAERQKAAKKLYGFLAVGLSLLALLAMWFAVYAIRKRRVVDQKNRSLVQQIAETASYKKLYEETHPQPLPISEGNGYPDRDAAESPSTPLPHREGLGGGADALFQHIHQVIKEKKLYLDPLFDRQAASDYFQITTRRVGEAFAQGSEYAKITDFINQLRLDHARELMTVHPAMNIDEVATSSGFAVRRTFSRLFKEKFGLTPSEYRNVYLAGIETDSLRNHKS